MVHPHSPRFKPWAIGGTLGYGGNLGLWGEPWAMGFY